MGCDGGTIPRRDELVRLKKKPEEKDKDAERNFKWHNCALTQQPLEEPIVACGLGKLYSKSSILEALLDKANKSEFISHIKSLKDVKDLHLTKNPAFVRSDRDDSTVDSRNSPYICPVIGIEMSGKFRFIFLWSCGCVFSERALKEIKTNVCHKCQKTFSDNDVVILNGTENEVEQLKIKMFERIIARKTSKKVKTEISTTNTQENNTNISEEQIQNSGCLSKPGSSKCEDIPKLGLPKIDGTTARGHFGSSKRPHGSKLEQDPSYKKTKTDYSIAKDPKLTDVYKSLFTSHKTEQEQQRAHWVTYNPFYN